MSQLESTETQLLRVESLTTSFFTKRGESRVLNGIDFYINSGEVLGLVGETGSGKSVTGFSLLRLVKRPGRIVGGQVWLNNRNLLDIKERDLDRNIRGSKISMIFQNPKNSLNPLIPVGTLLAQVLRTHHSLTKQEAYDRALQLLKMVRIQSPEERMRAYPHQLSGGMSQRIIIALAISCAPQLLIADEPTTGLDVTTQAEILDLLKELKEMNRMAQLFITHDLTVASRYCDRIAVMYAGDIVEEGPAAKIVEHPVHPYTRGLVSSRPRIGVPLLRTMQGAIPDMHMPPSGCRFHPRCQWATDRCQTQKPVLQDAFQSRVACWNWEEVQRSNVDRSGS